METAPGQPVEPRGRVSVTKTSPGPAIALPACRRAINARVKLGFTAQALYARAMGGSEILVDARGHRCPVPTLRLRKALVEAPAGARVRLLADDPMARIDVPHFAAEAGAEILLREELDGVLSFVVARRPA
jgi:tRNA 2-thiouridine synthesizing protein A